MSRMKRPTLAALTIAVVAVHLIASGFALEPAGDARMVFATNFYRSLVYHERAVNRNFLVSPAGVQKMLALVYSGAVDPLAKDLLWTLRLKHVDVMRLFGDALRAGITDPAFMGAQRAKQVALLSAPLTKQVVVDYFRDDFAKLNGTIAVRNYFVAGADHNFSKEFIQFARRYFAATTLTASEKMAALIRVTEQFNRIDIVPHNWNIFSSLSMHANWAHTCIDVRADTIRAKGQFKYGEISSAAHAPFAASVVQLPLEMEANFTLLLIVPQNTKQFRKFVLQLLGRSFDDFDVISRGLQNALLSVTLPRFKIKESINLAGYLEEVAYGTENLFSTNKLLSGIFGKQPELGTKLNEFWQKSALQIDACGTDSEYSTDTAMREWKWRPNETMKTLDIAGKSFFFVIRSDKVLYFMGHYIYPDADNSN